jgi:hypothetical protein
MSPLSASIVAIPTAAITSVIAPSARNSDVEASATTSAEGGGLEYQLRHYRIRPGKLDEFIDAWLRGVRPLRERFGFVVAGAWRVDDADQFVWILGYDGADGFAAADRRYYASEERKRLAPDPAPLIAHPESWMMRSVL